MTKITPFLPIFGQTKGRGRERILKKTERIESKNEEIQNEALYRACRAYGLGEQFLAAAQDEGTFGEWLDELPFEVAAATARLLKHHARSGAWVELSPGNPSQASRAGRDRDRSSPNCPSDMSELSENSD